MRFRYVGPEATVDLAVPQACIPCKKGQWLDVAETAEANYLSLDHMEIAIRGLASHPYWEVEDTAKPKRSRKPKTTEPPEEPDNLEGPEGPPDPPDAPSDDQEQDT